MRVTNTVLTKRPPGRQGIAWRLLNFPEIGIGAAIIIFFLAFSALDSSMTTPESIVLLLSQVTYFGIAAFGMSYLMLAGEIDLSTGAVAGLAAAVAAVLIGNNQWPEWAGVSAALAVAVLSGLLNSLVVLRIGVPSFFGTLGTHFMLLGLMQLILRGTWVSVDNKIPFLSSLAAPSPFFDLPWTFVLFVLLVIVGDVLIRRTRIGAILSATGGNRRAADISGINTALVKTLCFVLISICSAFGGLMVMTAARAGDPQIGDSWQLWVLAIAVIGGGSFNGGLGSVFGAFLGALLIQVIKIGLGAAQIKTNAQGVVVGAILIAAAILDVVRRRVKKY